MKYKVYTYTGVLIGSYWSSGEAYHVMRSAGYGAYVVEPVQISLLIDTENFIRKVKKALVRR